MPVITLQLGQCGNQLGYSFFQTLASELGSGDYHASGLDEWFRLVEGSSRPSMRLGSSSTHYVARSVLIDMEPKVVNSVMAAAAAAGARAGGSTAPRSSGWWRYPSDRQLCMSSGAGNNWAHGYHGYGPCVREVALELVRKEAEACDMLGGFVLLQSMAGGTGAGLGAYIAQALRDEHPAAASLNCCVWPYESGEVIVQPYNTLLTLSALAGSADGVVVMQNEALHRTAHRLYGLARPSFTDMNLVAARSLASLLLPSHVRPISTAQPAAAATAASGPQPGGPATLRSRSGSWPRSMAGAGSAVSPAAGDPMAPMRHAAATGPGWGASGGAGRPVRLLPELLGHVCCHPGYRLMSLRALPQMPAASVDFTTFTWPAITKRLRQMLLTGSSMEEGMDWGLSTAGPAAAAAAAPEGGPGLVTPPPSRPAPGLQQPGSAPGSAAVAALGAGPSSGSARGIRQPGSGGASSLPRTPAQTHMPSAAAAGSGGRRVNRAVSSWLVLRGTAAGEVDVGSTGLADPGLYPSWSVDPLAVSCHPSRFARCDMAAALLAADQAAVQPATRMLERAYSMFASRAYVHQYEAYGLQQDDFTACFAAVEDVVARYSNL